MSIYNTVNTNDMVLNAVDQFLVHFTQAVTSMKKAEQDMLVIVNGCPNDRVRKRYDRFHKKMIRIRRQYAALEQERESEDSQP